MKLAGHHKITELAIQEFRAELPGSSRAFAAGQLRGALGLSAGDLAVWRDLLDVLILGHWSNFAQKHHFMRRFDGQSPYAAYQEGCSWIRSNALEFAKAAAVGDGKCRLQSLANACHALEDSFADGHATRGSGWTKNGHGKRVPVRGNDEHRPDPIMHVKMYAGAEKEGHSHDDTKWWNPLLDQLSLQGRQAKNAVKAMLHVVFEAVFEARKNKAPLLQLPRWLQFESHYLVPHKDLGRQRDHAYDLIDEFYCGIVWGNTNTALNFNEKGLAEAVFSRIGVRTNRVRDVFRRLDDHHNSDADDVAQYYVEILQSPRGAVVRNAVAGDPRLVDLLIKVMDEGWTSGGEEKCIAFLRGLKKKR